MTKPACENCRFWLCQYGTENPGECRRHAPVLAPHYVGPLPQEPGVIGHTVMRATFPPTYWSNWCGDYEAKTT